MKNILIIAKNTFKEAVRDRILYGILGFSIIYVFFSVLLSKIVLGDLVVLKSFGLAGIYLFGMITAIFLGASNIYKEIERRTLYFVISKPVSRLELMLGKFLGLFAAVVLIIAVMTAVYLAVVFSNGGGFDKLGLLAIFYQILETGLFVALLSLFSTISTPLVAAIIAMMVLFAGHSFSLVLRTAKQVGGIFYGLIQAIYYLFPNLEKFDLRNLAVHGAAVSGISILLTIIYAIAYSAFLLWLANFFFQRKEL